jgi:hypothetical protein
MTARNPRPDARLTIGFSLVAFTVLVCGAFAAASGCGLSTGGILLQDGGAPCMTAAQCDDKDPCTTDTCGPNGFCDHTPAADGPAPPAEQPMGTCQKILCASGHSSSVEDDTNTPKPKDMCSTGTCVAGVPTLQDAPKGTVCTLMGAPGTCDMGKCEVSCTSASQCPSTNPCQVPSCDGSTGTCMYTNVSDGTFTPGVMQTPGSCQNHICLGGMDTTVDDPSNAPTAPPAAMAGCADAKCNGGTPQFPLHPTNSMCSTYMGNQPGFCDANGHCVACTTNAECPGQIDDCQHPACMSGACTTVFTPAGTATTNTPKQVPGDCKKYVCLGMVAAGMDYQQINDDTDPPNSGTACITYACSAGAPVPTIHQGTVCGMSMGMPEMCNAAGQCGCQTSADCTAPNTCGGGGTPLVCGCAPKNCAALGKTCGGPFSDGCFMMIPCDDLKQDGNETDQDCGGNTATCPNRCGPGKKCLVDGDCQTGLTCQDGVCCNTACGGACEACTMAKKGQGADGICGPVKGTLADPHGICTSDAASTCGDMMATCDGSGACAKWPAGTQCKAASCGGNTLTKPDTCVGGTCTAPNPATQDCTPYVCKGSACPTSCATDADCVSGYFCGGGNCMMKLTNGTACATSNQCQMGNCVSGFCCNSACNGKCQGCSGALTGGTNGVCGSVMGGVTDPSGQCTMQAASTCKNDGKCTAGGACEQWPPGTSGCSNPVACASGIETTETQCDGSGNCSQGATMSACANNLACANNMSCATTCTTNTTMGCIPGDYCANGTSCAPQLGAGQACGANAQCSSGVCGSTGTGHCCSSTANCMTGGTCGATDCDTSGMCVYPGSSKSCGGSTCNPVNSMLTTQQCDGSGTCGMSTNPCANGYSCMNGSSCNTSCPADTASGDTSCAPGYWCGGSTCVPAQGSNAPCTRSRQCTSGCMNMMCN